MSLISYAQNAEDVLLWRALKHVPHGFYIDVGANDPELHSVTKVFYDAGWHGINVEPMPSYLEPFRAARPRDINLSCAAGAASGSITLYEVPSMNGWATTDPTVADEHRAAGYEVTRTDVPLRTLADICAEHAPADIHFLKIDVEGFEGEVLKGMDFARWRPWVLVVEATRPGSTETCHEEWEHLVLPAGYRFAFFDGLNRFYVAEEQAALLAHFTVGPNVFDDYQSHHLVKALAEVQTQAQLVASHWNRIEELDHELNERVTTLRASMAELSDTLHARIAEVSDTAEHYRAQSDQLHHRLLASQQQLDTLRGQLHQADDWGRNMEQRLLAVYASTSWKLTRPLRLLARRGPNSLPNLARAFIKTRLRTSLRAALRWITARESLRRTLLPLMARSPLLDRLLRTVLFNAKQATSPMPVHAPDLPAAQRELPLSARRALADLRAALDTTHTR